MDVKLEETPEFSHLTMELLAKYIVKSGFMESLLSPICGVYAQAVLDPAIDDEVTLQRKLQYKAINEFAQTQMAAIYAMATINEQKPEPDVHFDS